MKVTEILLAAVPAPIAPLNAPQTVPIEHLRYIAAMSAVQVFTAFLLSLAFVLAVFITMAVACNWRKTALLLLVFFGCAVLFVPSGYCPYYGSAIITVAFTGLIWSFFQRQHA